MSRNPFKPCILASERDVLPRTNAQLGIRFNNGAIANIYSSFCVDDLQFYRNSLTLNFERVPSIAMLVLSLIF